VRLCQRNGQHLPFPDRKGGAGANQTIFSIRMQSTRPIVSEYRSP
jgi:hypothetical protein